MLQDRARALVLTVVALTASQEAQGAEPKDRISVATIEHQKGTIEILSYDGKRKTIPLKATVELSIVENESLALALKDPNPLLFTYKGVDIAPTDSPDYKVAKEFAESVKALVGVLPKPKSESGGAEKAKTVPCDQPPKSLGSQEDRRCFVMKFQPAITELSGWAQLIPKLTEESRTQAGSEEVKKRAAGWKVTESGDLIRKLLRLANENAIQLLDAERAKEAPSPLVPKEQAGTDAQYVDRVIMLADRIEKLLGSVEGFASLAKGINEPIELGTISYSAFQITGREVEIEAVESHADIAKKSGRKIGTFRFVANAYSPVHISLAPAVVYVFVEQPAYGTKLGADGHLRIVRTDTGGDVTGVQVGAMLSIQPRGWSNPTFGGSFQVGISPAASKIGLFAGASFHVFRIVSLGAGVAFQQRDELNEGLVEGQTVGVESDLKTHKRFRPGLFLSATVKIN